MPPVESVEPSTPERTPIPDTGSLSEHESQYSGRARPPVPVRVVAEPATPPEPAAEPVEPAPDTRTRHRARSQQASPEDVEQINALTKELRTKEAELATAKPEAVSGSPRLLALKRQIKAIEAELTDLKPKPEPAKAEPSVPSAVVAPPAAATPTAFTEPEPKIDDFADQADPYLAWTRAVARWDRRKEAFDEAQVKAKADQEAELKSAHAQIDTAYTARVQTFVQTHPDFGSRLERINTIWLPDVALLAIKTLPNGPELVYTCTEHPEILSELALLTDGKAVTAPLVASAQRWLTTRVAAVSQTGAAPTSKAEPSPPKPPTPVRTGPITTGKTPPDDGASLAEHEAFYSQKSRRR